MTPALGSLLCQALAQSESLGPSVSENPGTTASIVRTLLGLLLVCVAAWWALRAASQRGLLGPRALGHHARVIERIALDPRRSVVLLQVAKRVLVVGVSEQGLRTLAELSADELALESEPKSPEEPAKKRTFRDVLLQLTARPESPDDTP
ncbi:MAG: flagellar biosynthetic protein FliO [Deltaproteobacteria bacterium]|nr:flagellar biosynthetic protein FliO [Deltaproteobacteria bacterium]